MFQVGFSQPAGYTLASGAAKMEAGQKITSASQKITSLQCNFVQEKTSVLLTEKAISKGLLFYKKPNLLRWEYTSPTKLVLVLNAENVYLKNEQGTTSNSNKLFKQLGGLIISTINGDALADNENFRAEYYFSTKEKGFLWIKLIPVSKRIKDMYLSVWIKMDTVKYLASEIIMEEKSGDKTTIILTEHKLNTEISSKQFSVN